MTTPDRPPLFDPAAAGWPSLSPHSLEQPMTDQPTGDRLVADARRAVHEALVVLPAPEADRVRSLIADLETAVEARTAMRLPAVPVSSPPPDQTALRDRIADVLRKHYLSTNRNEADADGNLPCRCGDWREPGAEADDENDWDSHLADVALGVLPPPADRAAVLLWAADALPKADLPFVPPMDRRRVANWLRRLAAEAQQPDTKTRP